MKQIIAIIIALIIGLGAGFSLGVTKKESAKENNNQNTFQAGWNAAKERLKETGYIIDEEEIFSISGSVKEISGDSLTVKVNPLFPLADTKLNNRVVKVDKNTRIYRLKEKTEEQYSQELQAFNQKVEEMQKQSEEKNESEEDFLEKLNSLDDQEPSLFNKEKITISEIKKGDLVTVKAGKNIKNKQEFIAKTIEVEVSIEADEEINEEEME